MDFTKLLTRIAYYIASMSVVVKGGKLGKAINASSQSLSNLTFYNILLAIRVAKVVTIHDDLLTQ